jgi:hypothetical protein
MAQDTFEDQLLDQAGDAVADLATAAARDLPGALRPRVRRLFSTARPDGRWPEPELVQEVLRIYVDLVDEALVEDGLWLLDLEPADQRWLEACRDCVESLDDLDDVLHAHRASSDR